MALDLQVSGPGVDVHRRLAAGEPALILGRDSDCGICLPDPEREVSRRHLSVWNEGEQLHFHVLSVVNGVETAAGELLPPGARGVLPPGEALALSTFRILVAPSAVASAEEPLDVADPWAEFARQAEQMLAAQPQPTGQEDDPFGDWGFQTTFGPGSPSGPLRADALAPATDLAPFFAGLGLQPPGGALTRAELETVGRLTRFALLGLLQAAQASAAARNQALPVDPASPEPREANPLRQDIALEAKLAYLFGGQVSAAGFMPPDRAVAQVASELAAHQQAMGEAVPETLRKVVEEFDPEALKKRLLGGGTRIFEKSRAWDAFVRDYAERKGTDAAWALALLDRHFARAWARAIVRAKRNTTARPQG